MKVLVSFENQLEKQLTLKMKLDMKKKHTWAKTTTHHLGHLCMMWHKWGRVPLFAVALVHEVEWQ